MNGQLMRIETYGICVLPIQWMPVIRTSSGTAYDVLITGINNTVNSKTVFQMMVLISGIILDQVFL